jgi:hypothetical protein
MIILMIPSRMMPKYAFYSADETFPAVCLAASLFLPIFGGFETGRQNVSNRRKSRFDSSVTRFDLSGWHPELTEHFFPFAELR